MTDFSGALLHGLWGDGPHQRNRLLRLHTPLGPEALLAERAHITEGIGPHAGLPFAMEVLALRQGAALPPGALLGQPVLLELLTAHSRSHLRPFHGHVMACEALGTDGGFLRYRLQVGSWLDFLQHRTDAWVFQDLSVIEVTDAVLARHLAPGGCAPAWRWALNAPQAYPRRHTLTQFNESDADFLQRLWTEHGLFCWVEHHGQPDDARTLGHHTLVIADHNGALAANAQGLMRFTQSGTMLPQDSITQWHAHRRVAATTGQSAWFDPVAVAAHRWGAQADDAHAQTIALHHVDQPGLHAQTRPSNVPPQALAPWQALQAQREQYSGQATVRTLAPATTFVLGDHAEHDADRLRAGDEAARFAVLRVTHRARNNFGPALAAHLRSWSPDEPLYTAHFTAQHARVPVRPQARDASGRLLRPKPTVTGPQTAVVVGAGAPVHTDRDGRIQVQFHWQRGTHSSHRLASAQTGAQVGAPAAASPAADNAPARATGGAWVRVAQAWAGANWGSAFVPRVGQEVVVAFVEGDIDQPVVIGALYNGRGLPDAPGNQVLAGAAGATGHAPPWFPGARSEAGPGGQPAAQQEAHGEAPLEGHGHGAVLSGFKSQGLGTTSPLAAPAHNQLVMDDSPAQGRLLAHTTQAQTWLQMGHLLQQHGNQRLAPRGLGWELHTQAWGAVRAGAGLHLSTWARTGGSTHAQGQPLDTREAQHQLRAHATWARALGEHAQRHQAAPSAEPAAQQAWQATLDSLQAQASGPHGEGPVPASQRPELLLSAAGGISSVTPAHTVVAVGAHATFSAGDAAELLAQRHQAWAVTDGIELFTQGQAEGAAAPGSPEPLCGIRLHAATGEVRAQAHSDALTLRAHQGIDLQSTTAAITLTASQRMVLNGGGSYLLIDGGNIELGTLGPVHIGASQKVLTGGALARHDGLRWPEPCGLNRPQRFSQTVNVAALLGRRASDQALKADMGYRAYDLQGRLLAQGQLDAQGNTQPIYTASPQKIRIALGDGDWLRSADVHHGRA